MVVNNIIAVISPGLLYEPLSGGSNSTHLYVKMLKRYFIPITNNVNNIYG